MNASARPRPKPLVLVVLDGVGERTDRANNAVRAAKTPTLAALADYPRTRLAASGPDVGLPKGIRGGSEVGHLNLGAGRIATMDLSRIETAIADRTLRENLGIADVLRIAKHHFEARLHLFGVISEGCVVSSLGHLEGIIEAAADEEVQVVVHAFLDGRDAPPRSALGYVAQIEDRLDRGKRGVIGTLAGRMYALDPEPRWDRVNLAYKAIVRGTAPRAETAAEALARAYDAGKSDDLVEPVRIGAYSGMKGSFMADFAKKGDQKWRWYGEENALAWNFRGEGFDKLSRMLTRRDVPPEVEAEMLTDREKAVIAFIKGVYATLTDYGPPLGLPFSFPRETTARTFGEILAEAGLKQLRCAESDKREHVTTYWSGVRDEPFAGEDRAIVDSPPRASGKDPKSATAEVAARAAEAIRGGQYDFILVNLAAPDIAGRTGKLDVATRAVEAADAGLGVIQEAVREAGGALLVTSDHGNCELMKDERGQLHTGATTSRVPFYYVNEADRDATLRDGGRLADVAPTMLALLGLPQPEEMTGKSLLES